LSVFGQNTLHTSSVKIKQERRMPILRANVRDLNNYLNLKISVT